MSQNLMKAVIKSGLGVEGVQVSAVPVPIAGAGEAVLKVLATGICGTDVHIAHDEYPYQSPVVLGHEVLGVVDSVGSPEDAHWLGVKVAVETYFATCEVCDMCRAGRRNLCSNRLSIGSFRNGGFAAKLLIPVINLHQVPDTPGEFDGVLSEPLACITQCLLNPAVIQPGDQVLVTGPGAMGQLAAQVAKASGGRVTLAGLPSDEQRLDVASNYGISTITATPDENRFDVVIECSGSQGGAATALRSARKGARYVQVGIFGKDVSLPFDIVLYKELIVTSGFASTPESWRAAMRLIESGEVSLTPLITRKVALDDFTDALRAAENAEGLKTIVLGS
jgi:L-iditol 2-dehydrogenase